eukprot:TRINITY_DN8060_c0_g1_i2.p1 TRINITY_DN8060_c0_g1~~TRINITY_DN8060_c0_g1_i2.p1  ORF type:complete len:180 (-),score=18.12 TRINITY_DN8060_c0_g1_i2:552-1091(-)
MIFFFYLASVRLFFEDGESIPSALLHAIHILNDSFSREGQRRDSPSLPRIEDVVYYVSPHPRLDFICSGRHGDNEDDMLVLGIIECLFPIAVAPHLGSSRLNHLHPSVISLSKVAPFFQALRDVFHATHITHAIMYCGPSDKRHRRLIISHHNYKYFTQWFLSHLPCFRIIEVTSSLRE